MSNPTKAKRKGEEEESAAGKKAKHAVVVSGASSTAAPVAVKLSTATAFRVFLDGALTDADGVRHIPVPDLVNIVATYYGSVFCGIPGLKSAGSGGCSDVLSHPTTVLSLPAGSPFNADHEGPSLVIVDNNTTRTQRYFVDKRLMTPSPLYSSLSQTGIADDCQHVLCMCIDPTNPNRLYVGHDSGVDAVTVDASSAMRAKRIVCLLDVESIIASFDGLNLFLATKRGQLYRKSVAEDFYLGGMAGGPFVNAHVPADQDLTSPRSLCWAVGPTVQRGAAFYLTSNEGIRSFDVKSELLSYPPLHLADRHEKDSSEVFDPTILRAHELTCTNGGYLIISSLFTCDLYAMEVATGAVTFLSKTGQKRDPSGARFAPLRTDGYEFGSGMAIVETDRSIAIVDNHDHCIRRVPLPSHLFATGKSTT